MMEDQQNLKKNTGEVTQTKTFKKCRQTTDRLEKVKKKQQDLLVYS